MQAPRDTTAAAYFGAMADSYDDFIRRAVPRYEEMSARLVDYLPPHAARVLEHEGMAREDALMAAAMMHARHLASFSGSGYALTKRLVRSAGADAARASLPGELDELARMMDGRNP